MRLVPLQSLLRARLRLLVAVGLLGALTAGVAAGDIAARPASASADAYQIVVASNRDGVKRAYSLRSDGSQLAPLVARSRRLAPVAVAANGRTIAYMKTGIDPDPTGSIYVSRGSGAGFRRVERSAYGPALSRDGRLIAFSNRTLWIVGTNGRGRRRVAAGCLCSLDWSPNGKALVFDDWGESRYAIVVQPLRGKRRVLVRVNTDDVEGGGPTWSPDGRWIAYRDVGYDRPSGVWIVRPNGSRLHRVAPYAPAMAWSPDGRRLALAGASPGISIVGLGGRGSTRLRLDLWVGALAWSPDGRHLLVSGRAGEDPEQIWVVGADGRGLRRLTSVGSNRLVGWTRLAPARPAAPPIPPSERVMSADSVELGAPVTDLSADGPRVAFLVKRTTTDCHHPAVWTPGATSIERLTLQAPCWEFGWEGIKDVELAGTRAAWVAYGSGGYPAQFALKSSTLGGSIPQGLAFKGLERGQVWDPHVRGHGDLLVFNDGSRLVRIGAGREKCQEKGDGSTKTICATLKRGAHAAAVDSVSGGLIAIREPNAVAVLNGLGSVVRVFPFSPGGVSAARLDGDRLVVWRFGVLEAYDVGTGALEVSRTLPAGYRLVDVDGGVAVLLRENSVLLLALGDGRTRTFAPGDGPVFAELEPAGLYYSYRVGTGGRLVFVPRSELSS